MLTEKSHYHIWVNMTIKLNFNTKSFLNLFSVLYSCSKCISISHNFIFSGLVVKKPWTTEEKRSVLNILGRYVSSGTIPGKNACMDCIKRSQEALSGRTWTAVKFFVKNEISRRSRKISKWHAYLRIFLAGGVWCMVTLIYDDPPSLLIWICCPGSPCNGNFLRSLPCLAFFSLWLIILWQDTAFFAYQRALFVC